MPIAYIRNCNTFSDAMNNLAFELSVPEYYNTAIPDYFKAPRHTAKPIVNGQEVEWDDYLAAHPDAAPPDFIPRMIFKAEDANRAYGTRTCSEIIDLVDNGVPFEFLHEEDIGTVLGIFDGYYREIYDYIERSAELKQFVARLQRVRPIIADAYHQSISYHEANGEHDDQPKTLAEILATVSYWRS